MKVRLLGMSLLCALCLMIVSGVSAQTASVSPPQAAGDVRDTLFDAQIAVMGGSLDEAQAAVDEAELAYINALSATIAAVDPALDAEITAHFDQARASAAAGNAAYVAAARSAVWTALLHAASEVVYAAIDDGDGAQATAWLPLRDFRISTRFSRPGADATLAVSAFSRGELDADSTIAAVRADLLDTYQAQMNGALADAASADANGFALRRAEESALAAGYFDILAQAYGDQRGDDSLTGARASFGVLKRAAINQDSIGFNGALTTVGSVLDGFRAAPLSQTELARRSGQLMRFIALVPIEYGRGVRYADGVGVVTADIEIQEANTFYDGAAAAFADLQVALTALDADAVAAIAAGFDEMGSLLRSTGDPAAMTATANAITAQLNNILPAEWLTATADSDVDVILSVLDQVIAAAAQGEYRLAESARLEAYALLELGLEQRLVGFAPELAAHIEALFWQGTPERGGLAVLLANEAPITEVRAVAAQLEASLVEAQGVLGMGSAPAAVASNAAIIVFREGLEAVLILASLLASLRSAQERGFRRPLIIGAGVALLATALTWVLANSLLGLLLPLGERLEAIVSLIAIGVLLLITNWFFHKVYWTGWMANFHARKRRLIGGVVAISISQTVGLVLLGFTSIYREGFETVLFLQSLVLEAGIQVVLQGVLLGLIGTSVVGVITFGLQTRLPYKKMLVVTGVMIGFVLMTMVGHTVQTMQAVGWMPITPIQGVFIPFWMGQWFGLFATWQGIILQVASAVFVIGSYFLAEHTTKRTRKQAARKAGMAATA